MALPTSGATRFSMKSTPASVLSPTPFGAARIAYEEKPGHRDARPELSVDLGTRGAGGDEERGDEDGESAK